MQLKTKLSTVPPRLHAAAIRLCDILISLIILILFFPVLLLIACLIILDSPGGALFIQTRVGKAEKPFKIIKFRTMKPGHAPGELEYRTNSKGSPEPVVKIRNHQRVTRTGTYLRKYSLDELPQLLNVLIGNMSLVGSRPPIPEEAVGYSPYHKNRFSGKPGLTGLAQIHGRSEMDLEDIVRLDLTYNNNRTIWMYFRILVLSVPVIFSGKAAY